MQGPINYGTLTPTVFAAILMFAAILLVGCGEHTRDSSSSIREAKTKGIFVAEYVVPPNADLGDCRPVEIWVEEVIPSGKRQIVVRLQMRHHGGALRVRIAGLDEMDYLGIWSERNGPPYERWAAPDPLPLILRLERNGKAVEVRKL